MVLISGAGESPNPESSQALVSGSALSGVSETGAMPPPSPWFWETRESRPRRPSPAKVHAMDKMLKAFRLQAVWCADLGSPFTSALMTRMADDLEQGGPVAAILDDWPGAPLADAVSLRLTAALHAAVLARKDEALAAAYPKGRDDWDMEAVWPAARAFLAREAPWVRAFIQNAPQTNETRRAIGLLPGFLIAAEVGPLHLLEIGASAGLNQRLDGFRFETDTWSYGPEGGPRIDTDWRRPPPEGLDRPLAIASRAGCDVNPLDVRDPAQALRLKSYVWPDQPDRLDRIDRAIALAQREGVTLEKADAAEFLKSRLAGPLPEGTTIVFHSVVWQYLPEATKQGVQDALDRAAATATPRNRLAWLRYEPNPLLKDLGSIEGFGVALTLWPGGDQRRLASTDGHTRTVA